MNTFMLVLLMILCPTLAIISLLLILSINVGVIYGFICIIEWIGRMFKQDKEQTNA